MERRHRKDARCRLAGLLPVVILLILISPAMACPSTQCQCERNQQQQFIINCRHKSLTTIPTFTSEATTYYELTLAHNSIASIGNNAFQGLNIKKLDLSENAITSISDQAFNGLETPLEELVLHVNSISVLPSAALQRLTNLKKLTLKGFNLPALPSSPFSPLSKLTELSLISCGLTSISASDFAGLTSLTALTIQSNGITSVPTLALASLTNLNKLNLAQNRITALPTRAFQSNTKLTDLQLQHNGIVSINSQTFVGLESSLKILLLHLNSLTEAQLQGISILSSLEQLNLAYNTINSIPYNLFQSMAKLQFLNLHGNKISRLSQDSLRGLEHSLTVLILAENKIRYIAPNTFLTFTHLRDLHMDYQPLNGVLTSSTLAGLEGSLKSLSLEKTNLTAADWYSIAYLHGLNTLKLNENNIASIPDSIFDKMTQLHKVDLTRNKIRSVSQLTFHGLQNSLQSIILAENNLNTMDHCTFYMFQTLNEITLSGNPLQCDCHLQWLRRWLDTKYNDFTIVTINWKCSTPARHANKLFRNLKVQDLTCDTNVVPTQCPDLLATTTATSMKPSSTTTVPLVPLYLNASKISHDSFKVWWTKPSTSILTGYDTEYREFDTSVAVTSNLPSDASEYHATGLKSETKYILCITMKFSSTNRPEQKSCVSVTTLVEPPKPVTAGVSQRLAIILGSVFGVLAVVIVIVIIIVVLHRRGRDDPYDTPHKGPKNGPVPRVGYNSKRFSKPKSTDSVDIKKQLEATIDLTPEERDRILNMLTRSGASIISTASSQRYVPELPPRPPGLEGYLNPQQVRDEDDPNNHIYMEIGDTSTYI